MSWQMTSFASAAVQPWRNGGGVTRELLAWPAQPDWRMRMSVADVEAAGPFSRFPGIERWFAVLEGEGVLLRLPTGESRLTRLDAPLRFDGDADVLCEPVRGATRDFNLMAPPGRARMERVRGGGDFHVRAPALIALYTHAEPAVLAIGEASVEVPSGHLAWRLQDDACVVTMQGQDALWMEVTM